MRVRTHEGGYDLPRAGISPLSRYNYRFGWVCHRGGAPVVEFGQEGFDGLLELGFVDHE